MTTSPTVLQNGSMPTTVTNLRSQLGASGIPSGNSAFARSIHDFTRVVLGIEAAKSDLPPAPPQSTLSTFETPSKEASTNTVILARFRSYLSENNLSDLEVGGRTKCIPVVCRQFFVQDMAHINIHHNTGLLYKYAISPTDDTAANGQKILFRWIHGRQGELRKSARSLNWPQIKADREQRSKRKKQLSDHRVDTCVALGVPATLTRIFMDPACTSDTEEDDAGNLYRLHVPWRSQELTQFAHKLDEATVERLREQKGARYVQKAKLLELRRRNPINVPQHVRVPIGLPQNCYTPIYVQSRGQVAQEVLNTHNPPCEFPAI
ncbi:hypothetical protein PGTUg99_025207 [Puccinia graminis f. sp. tritici]|uniref:Uncharacterized protein n=1 Tax=Puccinia graminis f. sp. tritici TaxID=56615 RepID=A0A5B0M9P4_PUCGR|nr:hypothetical protein PGTUg99_025207 [Puccinia graminis f. sp. tritici]